MHLDIAYIAQAVDQQIDDAAVHHHLAHGIELGFPGQSLDQSAQSGHEMTITKIIETRSGSGSGQQTIHGFRKLCDLCGRG